MMMFEFEKGSGVVCFTTRAALESGRVVIAEEDRKHRVSLGELGKGEYFLALQCKDGLRSWEHRSRCFGISQDSETVTLPYCPGGKTELLVKFGELPFWADFIFNPFSWEHEVELELLSAALGRFKFLFPLKGIAGRKILASGENAISQSRNALQDHGRAVNIWEAMHPANQWALNLVEAQGKGRRFRRLYDSYCEGQRCNPIRVLQCLTVFYGRKKELPGSFGCNEQDPFCLRAVGLDPTYERYLAGKIPSLLESLEGSVVLNLGQLPEAEWTIPVAEIQTVLA